ncbi:hypothetical protein AB4305_20075 [Nocardia sp. 2YAB30]|uniref:hypothetical protein n=1 Tax=unclassified Nocardia TaxID=2637762 RepID=UPI003F967EC4
MTRTCPLISEPEQVRAVLGVPSTSTGMTWVRVHVAQFCDEAQHQRRALVQAELGRLSPAEASAHARAAAGSRR